MGIWSVDLADNWIFGEIIESIGQLLVLYLNFFGLILMCRAVGMLMEKYEQPFSSVGMWFISTDFRNSSCQVASSLFDIFLFFYGGSSKKKKGAFSVCSSQGTHSFMCSVYIRLIHHRPWRLAARPISKILAYLASPFSFFFFYSYKHFLLVNQIQI